MDGYFRTPPEVALTSRSLRHPLRSAPSWLRAEVRAVLGGLWGGRGPPEGRGRDEVKEGGRAGNAPVVPAPTTPPAHGNGRTHRGGPQQGRAHLVRAARNEAGTVGASPFIGKSGTCVGGEVSLWG